MDMTFPLPGDDGMHTPPGNEFAIGVEYLHSVVEPIGDVDFIAMKLDARWFGEQAGEATPVAPCLLQLAVIIENQHTVVAGVCYEDIAKVVDIDSFR